MPEAIAGDVIEPDFCHQFRFQWFPLAASVRAPSARTARCFAGKARRSLQGFELPRQLYAILLADRRRKPNVIQFALLIVKPKQQRADLASVHQIAKSPDHAIGCPQALDLDHRSLARPIDIVEKLGDNAVR